MSCTSWTSLSLWLTEDSDMAEVVDRRSMVSRSSTKRSCDDSRDSRLETSQLETEHIIIVVALLWTLWLHSGDYKIYPRTQYIFRISATDRKQLRAGQVQKWRSRNNKNSYINTECPGCGMIWSNMIRTICKRCVASKNYCDMTAHARRLCRHKIWHGTEQKFSLNPNPHRIQAGTSNLVKSNPQAI